MSVRCQYVSNDEPNGCDNEAERVMRQKSTGRHTILPPWRNRVPFCREHREHLLTDPSVEIPWEDQGHMDEFPEDNLYQHSNLEGQR